MNAPLPPRQSPREELASLTEARVMAALAAILRRGGEDVTFDLVSRESGVPARTLYRYFENREALFGAFWRWVNESIEMPAVPTTPEEVVGHIPALFAAFDRDEALIRAMLHNPYGRAVRLAHAEARRAKFSLALRGILEALPADSRRNLLASVTALCSAAGWETMRDNWRLGGASAARAAEWAVRALLDAASAEAKAARNPAKAVTRKTTVKKKGRP